MKNPRFSLGLRHRRNLKLLSFAWAYSLILCSAMIYQGCSGDTPTASSRFVANQGSGTTQDEPADTANTPPKATTQLPDPQKDPVKTWSTTRLNNLRDKVANAHCTNKESRDGKKITTQLAALKCRVEEQQNWLQDRLIYDSRTNNSCITQTRALSSDVLAFAGKDTAKNGSEWHKYQCKKATDQAMENLKAESREKTNQSVTEEEVKRELLTVLNERIDYSSKEKNNAINTMVMHSLYKLNNNCAANMETDPFLSHVTKSDENKYVKPSYLLRRTVADEDSSKTVDPLIAASWKEVMEHEEIKAYTHSAGPNSAVEHEGGIGTIKKLQTYLGYPAVTASTTEVGYPIRQLKLDCKADKPEEKVYHYHVCKAPASGGEVTCKGKYFQSLFDRDGWKINEKIGCSLDNRVTSYRSVVSSFENSQNTEDDDDDGDDDNSESEDNPGIDVDGCKIHRTYKDDFGTISSTITETLNTLKREPFYHDGILCWKTIEESSDGDNPTEDCLSDERFSERNIAGGTSQAGEPFHTQRGQNGRLLPVERNANGAGIPNENLMDYTNNYRGVHTASPISAFFKNTNNRLVSVGQGMWLADSRDGSLVDSEWTNARFSSSPSEQRGWDFPDGKRITGKVCLYKIHINVDGFKYSRGNVKVAIPDIEIKKRKVENRRALEKVFGLKTLSSTSCGASVNTNLHDYDLCENFAKFSKKTQKKYQDFCEKEEVD